MEPRITRFAYLTSNPSLGPHEVKTTAVLSADKVSAEDMKVILSETRVNGVVSLGEYIQLCQDKNDSGLRKAREAYGVDPSGLNEGEAITEFVVSFEGGDEITFFDINRRWDLSGRERLSQLFKDHGSVHTSDPTDPDDPVLHEPAPLPKKKPRQN